MSSEKTGGNLSSDITGRKIFFLYPTASMQSQIITVLVQQEYEVYNAKDHGRLENALKNYPDSVVYVNLDSKISEEQWEKWIIGIHSSFPSVKIGCFSSNADEELVKKYIDKLHVTCGFMTLKLDLNKTVSKILKFLDIINAKGRRKYLRASIDHNATAAINVPLDGGFLNGVIKDISVVGIACVFERDPELKKNVLCRDIQIKLQSMLLKAEAVVFGSRENNGEKIYVLLFTQRIDPDTKVKIRKYIQHNLQTKIDHEIN